MKRGVFITVDVECSMGGAWGDPALRPVTPARAIWGEFAGRRLGLPLITDILAEHNLAATFFVEAFTDEQGYPGEMERVCAYLLDRGQDVQLHIHPNHRDYGRPRAGLAYPRSDMMADRAPAELEEMLAEGCERLRRWTGKAPAAFRAGNMGASEATLASLAAAGIRIDSSYTFPYTGHLCRFRPEAPYNGSRWYGEVLELALSGFYSPRLPGLRPARPLNLSGVSLSECRAALGRIAAAGADAVVILHSFSLLKVRSVQYDGGRPDRIVTRRLRRLCAWLAARADEMPTHTFSRLAEALREGGYEARHVPPPRLSAAQALARTAAQLYNRPYWT